MKSIVLFIIFLIGESCFCQTIKQQEQIDRFSILEQKDKDLIIPNLLKQWENSELLTRKFLEESLIRMGHVETIQRVIAQELQVRSYDVLSISVTEEAIPYLMPYVLNGEKRRPETNSDVTYLSIRSEFSYHLLKAIRDSKKLPPETVQWAKGIDLLGMDRTTIPKAVTAIAGTPEWSEQMTNWLIQQEDIRIDLLKQWWENNQTAILEKRYADATWLPRYKGKPATYSLEEIAERKADDENERASREAKRAGESDIKKSPAANAENPLPLWPALVAALFTIVSGIYYFKKRSRA
jgi:hypothetical protein